MRLPAIFYISFSLFLSLFSYLFIDPNFIYLKDFYTGFAFRERGVVTFVYLFLIIGFFSSYIIFLKQYKEVFNLFKKHKNVIAAVLLVLISSYPAMLSYDIFNYVTTAKVTYSYLENPFVIMPIEFIGDPALQFTHAANKLVLYGPVWVLLAAIPYLLALQHYLIAVYFFKMFVAAFWIALVWLIYKITKNIYSVIFFAANPLVLIETFVSGHNDVVMMFLALFALFLFKQKRYILAVLFIIFSILIKYATIFLLPLFVYYFIKRVQGRQIKWERVYMGGFLLMLLIFFLSPLRVEIYPWYAIWPLTFLALIVDKKKAAGFIFIALCFGLMLRYIPYMYLGNHLGITPMIKILVTFVPPILLISYLKLKGELKLR